MNATTTTRRTVLITAAAALAPMHRAAAQTAAAGGDWLDMIKVHHAMVAKTFDALLSSSGSLFSRRSRLLLRLSHELSAHSLAEENVIYPALALRGLVSESDKLYLDQSHTKVMTADVKLTAPTDEAAWMSKVAALQAAVLRHAKIDEEQTLYPRLHDMLDARANALLGAQYMEQFETVRPERPEA
jgi:hemerythrin superfamily protein